MICFSNFKENGYTFRGGNSVSLLLPPFSKGSTQKEKNSLPVGANSFLLEQTPFFQKGLGAQEDKQEVTKVVSLAKIAESAASVSSFPYSLHRPTNLNFALEHEI